MGKGEPPSYSLLGIRLIVLGLALALAAAACGSSPNRPLAGPSPSAAPSPKPAPSSGLEEFGAVRDIARIVPPGELLAVEREDPPAIALVDPETGREQGVLPAPPGIGLTPLSWSPDGSRLLYVASSTTTCTPACKVVFRVADLAAGKDAALGGLTSFPYPSAWLDADRVLVGVGSEVEVLDVRSSTSRSLFGSHSTADGIATAGDGRAAMVLRSDYEGAGPPPPSERSVSVRLLTPAFFDALDAIYEATQPGYAPEWEAIGEAQGPGRSRDFESPRGVDRCESPVFSADVRKLGITCSRADAEPSGSAAWVLDLASGRWSVLLRSSSIAPVGHIVGFTWTPDQGRLLIRWSGECEVPDIYTAAADGYAAGRLFPRLSGPKLGSVSPDGRRLALSETDCGGEPRVYLANLDGSQLREIGLGDTPIWSPRRR